MLDHALVAGTFMCEFDLINTPENTNFLLLPFVTGTHFCSLLALKVAVVRVTAGLLLLGSVYKVIELIVCQILVLIAILTFRELIFTRLIVWLVKHSTFNLVLLYEVDSKIQRKGLIIKVLHEFNSIIWAWKLIQFDALLDQSYHLADFLVLPHSDFLESLVPLQAGLNEVAGKLLLENVCGRAVLSELGVLLRLKDDPGEGRERQLLFAHIQLSNGGYFLLQVQRALHHHHRVAARPSIVAILKEVCYIHLRCVNDCSEGGVGLKLLPESFLAALGQRWLGVGHIAILAQVVDEALSRDLRYGEDDLAFDGLSVTGGSTEALRRHIRFVF